ncbi:hypothetical protein ACFX2J_041472 [Malus domestica]
MADMEKTELKKSDSAGLDNSITPDSSMSLVEYLEEMDQSMKQMLKLIKEDGDSLPNKDEMFLQKNPELVQEFHRMYRSLAGCYNHLNKAHKGFGDSEYGFNQGSPLLTPDAKHGLRKSDDQVVGFDISLSSDGSSPALSIKNGAESSSSSSLGSESDSPNSPVSNYLVPPPSADFDSQGWQQKIAELEREAPDKDNEIRKLMEDLEVTKKRPKGSNKEIANLKHELADRISKGADQMQGFESQLDSERKHVSELQERIVRSNADIFGRDLEVMQLKGALRDAQEQFSLEKADLQADISSFAAKQIVLDTRLKRIEFEKQEVRVRNKAM